MRELPPEQQQEVLDFASFLGTKKKRPLKSLRGLWKDPGISFSEEDIGETPQGNVGQLRARAVFRVSAVVADTHRILWDLSDDPRLSRRASDALDKAKDDGEPVFIPTICVMEATYLIEKNRIESRGLSDRSVDG